MNVGQRTIRHAKRKSRIRKFDLPTTNTSTQLVLSDRYRSRPFKARRRRWTQKDMTSAYNAVKYRGYSLRGAANTFNVPESTLRDRIHGRVSLDCARPGPPTFFNHEEEKRMVNHILYMSKIGYPFQRNQVTELAGDMTKAVSRVAPFKGMNPSQAWFYAFTNRWPDLRNHIHGQRSSNRRTRGVSAESLNSYFEQLDRLISKIGVKDNAGCFWTMDDLSITYESHPPRLVPIGHHRTQQSTFTTPNVTLLSCGSATGSKLPPFLVHRTDDLEEEMSKNCVVGTRLCVSPNGWMNPDLFLVWLIKHFVPRLPPNKRPIILLYDGHLQYITLRVLDRAKFEGIVMFPLPPHPAHNHCVENTCFWAFDHYFTRAIRYYFHTNKVNHFLNRNTIGGVICHAEKYALQSKNLTHLFLKLGICPFNNIAAQFGAYYGDENGTDELSDGCNPQGGTGYEQQAFYFGDLNGIEEKNEGTIPSMDPLMSDASTWNSNLTSSPLLSFDSASARLIARNKIAKSGREGNSCSPLTWNTTEWLDGSKLSMEQVCRVCNRVEPPNHLMRMEGDLCVVDWAHCSYCLRYIHMHACMDMNDCYSDEGAFMCAICYKEYGNLLDAADDAGPPPCPLSPLPSNHQGVSNGLTYHLTNSVSDTSLFITTVDTITATSTTTM